MPAFQPEHLGLIQYLYIEVSELDHGLTDRLVVLEDLSWIQRQSLEGKYLIRNQLHYTRDA